MDETFKVGDIIRVIQVDPEVDFGYDVGDVGRIIEVRPAGTEVHPPAELFFMPVVITEQVSYEVEWISNKRTDLTTDDRATNMYPGEIELVS